MPVDLNRLRDAIADGTIRLRIEQHARTEAFKEGFSASDLRQAVASGDLIEEYPTRERVLLLGWSASSGMPMHVVLQYADGDAWATVVTVYLPDDQLWFPGYRTRR